MNKPTLIALYSIAVVILVAFSYSNIYYNAFVHDDLTHIVGNNKTRELSQIPGLFLEPGEPDNEEMFRPLRATLYTLSFNICSEGNNVFAPCYHIFSVTIYLLTVFAAILLVYALVRNLNTAFITGLLFGVHPIHSNLVNLSSFAHNLLGYIFIFICFALWIWYRRTEARTYFRWFFVFHILALLATEEAILILPFILVYDFCYKRIDWKLYIPTVILSVVYLIYRTLYLGGLQREAFTYIAGSPYLNFINFPQAAIMYLKNLLTGTITFHPEYPLVSTLFDWRVILPLLGISVLGYLIFRSRKRLLIFCYLFFFTSLLLYTGVPATSSLYADRYVFMGSLVFCLAIVYIATRLWQSTLTTKFSIVKKATLILLLVFVMFQMVFINLDRNMDFRTLPSFYASNLEANPGNCRSQVGLADAYYRYEEDYDTAKKHYTKAIEFCTKNGRKGYAALSRKTIKDITNLTGES